MKFLFVCITTINFIIYEPMLEHRNSMIYILFFYLSKQLAILLCSIRFGQKQEKSSSRHVHRNSKNRNVHTIFHNFNANNFNLKLSIYCIILTLKVTMLNVWISFNFFPKTSQPKSRSNLDNKWLIHFWRFLLWL